MEKVLGTVIDAGVSDWQIFQQNKRGLADIRVSGRWGWGDWPAPATFQAQIRLVSEETSSPVSASHCWQDVAMKKSGTWSAVLKGVPAGGLYRLETRLWDTTAWGGFMGDCRHFLGVGDIWVIAGQSNSAGYGREPAYDPPELGVHLLNNAMRWTLATQPGNETTDTAHRVNREGYPQHGPWLSWAKNVRRAVGHPIGLVQVSLGGSPLSMWNPAEKGSSGLYELLVQAVHAAGGARGVLWYQGESDSGPGAAERYGKRFIAAVRAWRKAVKIPDLHVLTVQLNRVIADPEPTADRCWSIVRETQRTMPTKLPHCSVVPALDQPLSDGIHNSAHGNLLLGQRAALVALGAAYGQDVNYRAPEPVAAKRNRSGTQVTVSFGNISGVLTTIDMRQTIAPFVVEDADGRVPLSEWAVIGKTVRLKLGRKLAGKAVVHGGYGMHPPLVPHDLPRAMPMLAFFGFPVDGAAAKSQAPRPQ